MAKIEKGDDLMLFDAAGKSMAFATSHVLTITGETTDVTSKDHGIWQGNEVSKFNWEITSENLYTMDLYDDLFDKMMSREPMTVYFGKKKENDPDKSVADGDYPNWTVDAGANKYVRTGKVLITSLVANANTGENATCSVTLTGTGKISKANAIPTTEP